jgi:FkbM family methyltransferase
LTDLSAPSRAFRRWRLRTFRAALRVPGIPAFVLAIDARHPSARVRPVLRRSGRFPNEVRLPLDPIGDPGSTITMAVGVPWDQVAVGVWADGVQSYEPPVPLLVRVIAQRSARVAIVGTSSGFYCLLAAVVAPHLIVDAIEPWPRAIERLQVNLEHNGVRDRVRVHRAAAGAVAGSQPLYVPEPEDEDWPLELSASLSPDFRPAHSAVVGVQVTTVDDIRAAQDGPIGLVLVDAEGCDVDVLVGAGTTLGSDRPFVITEMTADQKDRAEALAAGSGYLVAELAPGSVRLGVRVAPPARRAQESGFAAVAADPWIQLLVPSERVADLRSIADEAGLTVHDERS